MRLVRAAVRHPRLQLPTEAMKPATLKALKASIAHWERLDNNGPSKEEPIGCDSCALCKRFANVSPLRCTTKAGERCPVFAKTGSPGCKDSPYGNALYLTLPFGNTLTPGVTFDEWRAAARRELAFLRSLLPKP